MPTKFETLKGEFKTQTDLDPKTNVDTYIQYVQARLLEEILNQQKTKMDELIKEVKSIGV